MPRKSKKKTPTKNLSIKDCPCQDVVDYTNDVLNEVIRTDKEIKQQYTLIKEEFQNGNLDIDLDLYNKYLKIGHLFFDEIFPYQKSATALCLCTFYKGTKRARWNKCLILMGRGNGKDGMIAWWSCCLTSVYHGIKQYDVDIIANNMIQSLRPIEDIRLMAEDKKKTNFYGKIGDSIESFKTNSYINARSSDAKMQDGLRSGCIIFNELHGYENYAKLNVLKTGLGKVDDPRQLYFTTNGETRGSVLDDMLDTAKDVLDKTVNDRRTLYLIYKLDDKKEVDDKENWIKANPSLPYRETLRDEIEDEYEDWRRNPQNMPAFLQKRMNLPEVPTDQEVVPWEVIVKTNQPYDYERLKGRSCVLGIDLSKTTDWTAINLLFYDDEIDKYICLNHAFICGNNRDLGGIKAPYQEWCNKGFGTIINDKEVDPNIPVDFAMKLAEENGYDIVSVVIDDFKKGLLEKVLEKYNYTRENETLTIIRPSNIAQVIPIVERAFINERFIWGDNPMLRWATNNTKVIPWKNTRTTGENDMGNQLYAKINARFRKTDPFMALVHSMVKHEEIEDVYIDDFDFNNRGFL